MVAVISSNNLGLYTSNGSTQGTPGANGTGQSPDQVYVNTTTGNLVIQQVDESLAAVGMGLAVVRTYNSQGLMNDDNGDNWRIGLYETVYGLTGTVNTAGSTVHKVFGDGADITYTYNGSSYVSSAGSGASDTLSFNAATSQWTWTDGSSRETEIYNASGQLLSSKDTAGNTDSYAYNANGLLTSVTDASGQTTYLDYSGTNPTDVTDIRVVSNGQTQTRTHYTYDASNRLSQVIVDLTPADNSIADGKTYVTTYTYDTVDSTNTRIASITQGDGTTVKFTYVQQDGQWRVHSYTDGLGNVTTYSYSQATSAAAVSTTASANQTLLSTAGTQNVSANLISGALSTTSTQNVPANLISSALTTPAAAPIAYSQGNSSAPQSNQSSVTVKYTNAQAVGDLNVIAIGWGDSTSTILTIKDSSGNTYTLAAGPTKSSGNATQSLYYAKNIVAAAAGSNTVTVTFSKAVAFPDVRIAEYSGIDTSNPLDVAVGKSGSSTSTSSGSIATTNAKDLIIGANYVAHSTTGAGSGYTQRLMTADQSIFEDKTVTATGSYSATAPQSPSGWWVMQLAAFKAASSGVPYYSVPSGATWQSIANTLYGVNSAAAGTALQTAMGSPTLTTNLHLTGFPTSITVPTQVTVSAYYPVPSGATWQSIANTLYGVNSAAAGTALQTAMGNPALTTGAHLTGFPATLTVSGGSSVPAYYTVQSGDTWASITRAIYGASDTNAITALQTAVGTSTLSVSAKLTVPLTLTYTPTYYLQTTVTDPLNQTTFNQVSTYQHDSAGRLIATINAAGIETDYAYNADGKVTTVTEDPTGLNRVTTYNYDANDNLILTRDADGNTVTRTYNAANQLVTQTQYLVPDPDGAGSGQPGTPETTWFVYDSESHLRFTVSSEGRVTEYRYNAAGERTSMLTYAGGEYAVAGLTSATTLTEAQLTSWVATQNLTQLQRVDYSYDFRGQVSSATAYATTDTSGNGVATGASETQYVYDQRGLLLQTINPLGSGNTPNASNAALSYATTLTYDGLGRVLTTTQWLASGSTATTVTQYNDAGQTTTTTAANGLMTASAYNADGELLSVTQTASTIPAAKVAYSYDADGQLRIITTDPGKPTQVQQFLIYDTAGRKVGMIDGTGALTEYDYNNANQIVKTVQYADALTTTTLATLVDGSGNPINPPVTLATLVAALPTTVGRASDQIARNVYDSAGRLTYSIDAAGDVTQYSYDGENHVTDVMQFATPLTIPNSVGALRLTATPGQVMDPATGTVYSIVSNAANDRHTRNFYGTDGELAGTLDGAGDLVTYTYDAAGRLTQKTSYANPASASLWQSGTLSQLIASVTPDPVHDINCYYFYDGEGRQVGELDGDGYLTATQYDIAGEVVQTTRYDAVLTYSAGATVTSLQSAVPGTAVRHTTSYQYNGAGQVIQETNYEGTITAYSYDIVGDLISTTVAQGTSDARTTQTQYDALGRVIAQLSGVGSTALAQLLASNPSATQAQINALWSQYGVTYAYDSAGRRISATTQPTVTVNGVSTSTTETTYYYYDADGRLRFTVDALGEVTENRYNALGQVVNQINYNTPIATTGLTGGLLTNALTTQLTASANANADANTTYTYTLTGQLKSRITAEGSSVTDVYTAFGQLLSSTTVSATENDLEVYSYDQRGLLTESQSDPNGIDHTQTNHYDAFGRLTSSTDQYGNKTSATYDRLGRVLASTDAFGNPQSTTYDAFSRTLSTTDALGNVTHYQYTDATNSMTVTTPAGVQVTTAYNHEGQTLSVLAAGNTTTYSYDQNGNLIQTSDNLGTLDSRSYDSAGREVTDTNADNIVTRLTYDAADRVLTSTVDPTGLNLTTSYVYDGQGRVIQVTEPGKKVTNTSYDREGRVTQVVVDPTTISTPNDNPNGLNLVTTYSYNANNQTVTVTVGAGSSNPQITQTAYNALGERTSDTVLMQGTEPQNLLTQYFYDKNGNLTHKIDANTNSTWYLYDADNRLVDTIDALGGVTQTSYDADSRVVATRRLATALSAAQLTSLATALAANNTTTAADVTLTFSTADRLQQTVYDQDGRAVYSIDAMGGVTQRTFDANGNVIAMRVYANPITILPGGALPFTAFVPGTTTYPTTASALAAVATALGNAGNNTAVASPNDRMQWNAYDIRGRKVATIDGLGDVTQYQYDAAGQVISTTQYAKAIQPGSIPDGVTQLTGSVSQTTGLLQLTATTASGSTTFSVATTLNQDRTTLTWYDALGRVRFVLNADGYLAETQYNDAALSTKQIVYMTQTGVGSAPTITSGEALSSVMTAAAALSVPTLDESTTTQYDAAGRVISITDALQHTEYYGYDAVGNKIWYTNQKGSAAQDPNYTWHYLYDANHRLMEEITPAVSVTSVANTSPLGNGTLTSSTKSAQIETRMTYDNLGNVLTRTEGILLVVGSPEDDSQWRVTTYTYDKLGRQVSITFPAVDVYKGVLNATTNPNGDNLALTGNSVTRGDGSSSGSSSGSDTLQTLTSHVTYDVFGEAIVNQDVAGNYSYKVYDALGRVTYDIDANNNVTQYTYDAFGNQQTLTRYANALTLNNNPFVGPILTGSPLPTVASLTANVTASGISITAASTASSATVNVAFSPAQDRVITTAYDRLNRVVSVQQGTSVAQGGVVNYTPNATSGTIGTTFTANPTTLTQYNAFGQVICTSGLVDPTTTPPTYANTYYYYDQVGQKTAQVVQSNATTYYLTTYTYDAVGNLTDQTDWANPLPVGTTLLSATPPLNPAAGTVGLPNSLGLDRETAYTYDQLNRKISQSQKNIAYSVSTTTAGSSPTTPTTQTNNQTTSYTYDALGNQTSVAINGGTTYSYYDVLGRVIALAQATDALFLAKLVNGQYVAQPPITDNWQFTAMQRDAYGNLVVETQYAAGTASAGDQSTGSPVPTAVKTDGSDRTTVLLLDSEGHALQTEQVLGTTASPSYLDQYASYDARGELAKTWQIVTNAGNGGSDGTTTDAIVTVYQYDNLGHQTAMIQPQLGGGTPITQSATYNAFGEMISQSGTGPDGGTVKYEYDQAGRLWRTDSGNGAYKVYLYNLAGKATAEIQTGYNSTQASEIDLSSANSTVVDTLSGINWVLTTTEQAIIAADGANSAAAAAAPNTTLTESLYDYLGNVVQQRQPTFMSPSTEQSFVATAQVSLDATSGHPFLTWTGTAVADPSFIGTVVIASATNSYTYTSLTPTPSGESPIKNFGAGGESGYDPGVDLMQLAPGSYTYTITYARAADAGTPFVTSTGAFTYAPTTTTTISALATVTEGGVSGVSASVVGSSTLVSWTADSVLSAAQIEIFMNGAWQPPYVGNMNPSVPYSYSAQLPLLAAGTYQYRITDTVNNGLIEALGTGTITSSGSVYSVSGANISNLSAAPTAPVAITNITAALSGNTVNLSWAAPNNSATTATLLINGVAAAQQPQLTGSAGAYTFQVTGLSVPAGNSAYTITENLNGQVLATASGTLSFTAATSTSSTTLAISPTPADPGAVVGPVTISGSTLSWTASLSGNTSGNNLTASITLQQGTTPLTPTITSIDSTDGTTRTFSVNVATLPAGTWTYTINQLRNGVAVGAATGSVSSSGPSQSYNVSGASVSANPAPTAPTPITSIITALNGSAVNVSWAAPNNSATTATFVISGVSTPAPSLTGSEGGYTFQVNGINFPASGTYTYTITETLYGQTTATATGTITYTAATSTTTTSLSSLVTNTWLAINPVTATGTAAPQASGSVSNSSAATSTPIMGESGQTGTTYSWTGNNVVNATWLNVGSQAVTVYVYYNTLAANGASSVAAVSPGIPVSSGGTGATLSWTDSQTSTTSQPTGGISSISYILVKNSSGTVLCDSRVNSVSDTHLALTAPSGYSAQLSYSLSGSSTATTVAMTTSGGQFIADLSLLPAGTYNFSITQYPSTATAESPQATTETGQFVVPTSGSVSIANQTSATPPCLTTVTQSGNQLNWSGAIVGGGGITVTATNTSTLATTTLTATNQGGANYSASLYNLPTGPYTYQIQYVNSSGTTYLLGTGSVTVTTTTTNNAATVANSTPTHAEYPIANIVPTASASSSLLSWNYAALSGVTTNATLYYSLNGGATQSQSITAGSGSFNFNSIANGAVTVTYQIVYVRTDTNMAYAAGSGTFSFTATTTAVNSTVTENTETSAYPNVPGITGLSDLGGGVMGWTTPASGGGTVQVSYRQGTGAWSAWTAATPNGSGYSFNFNALSGAVQYEIQYVVAGQNPYIQAFGTVNVTHTTTPIAATLTFNQPSSHTEYPVANIVPTASATSSLLSWSYAALSGPTTQATLTYSINGGAQQQYVTSGPGSFNFNSIANGAVSVAYKIVYVRTDNNTVYATGSGTFSFTATTATTASATAASNLTAITGFTQSGGVLSWTTSANAGDTVVFQYTLSAQNWSNPPLTLQVTNNSVTFPSTFPSGNYIFEVKYYAAGQSVATGTPHAVGGGILTVGHGTTIPATTVTDTTTATLTALTIKATPTQIQTFDRWGDALTVMDAANNAAGNGYKTVYQYNQFGQVTKVTQPKVTQVNVAQATIVNGVVTAQNGAVTLTTDTPVSYNYYDLYGELIGTMDADGNVTQAVYNVAGEKLTDIEANGAVKSYVYDAFGEVIQTTDELGYRTRNQYDQAGRLVATVQEVAPPATSSLNGTAPTVVPAQFSATDNSVLLTQYAYDQAGRRIAQTTSEVILNESGTITAPVFTNVVEPITNNYWYDLQGNVVKSRMHNLNTGGTPNGIVTTYAYDAQGHKIFQNNGDSTDNTQTWTYNYFGQLIGETDLGGAAYIYHYDTKTGLLTSQTSTGGENGNGVATASTTPGENQSFSYDAANHLTEINDTALNRQTYYGYDSAGRQATVITVVNKLLQEDTRTQFDTLDRIAHLSGIGFSETYSYDAAGNRTHIDAYYLSGSVLAYQVNHQDLWYQYDAMNRVTISQGVNLGYWTSTGAGVRGAVSIVAVAPTTTPATSAMGYANTDSDSATQGTTLTYDARGDRTSATTNGNYLTINGSVYKYQNGAAQQNYTYDGLGRLITTTLSTTVTGVSTPTTTLIDTRVYNRESQVTQDVSGAVDGSSAVWDVTTQNTSYNANGLTLDQNTSKAVGTGTSFIQSDVSFGQATDYDAAGNVMHYQVSGYNAGVPAYTSQDNFTYRHGMSFQQLTQTVATSGASIQNGNTTNTYNADGELIEFADANTPANDRYFMNNAAGEALTVVKGAYGAYDGTTANAVVQNAFNLAVAGGNFFNSGSAGYFFFSADGQAVGSFSELTSTVNAAGVDTPTLKANFDVNYTPISPSYPASVPATYVVIAGDTLRTIAAKLFGDPKLWYVIAQANGLTDPNATLPEGRVLTIPNQVVSLSNDASTFKPFSVQDAIGDTTPSQPALPQPSSGGGCGIIGTIIGVIICIIIDYYSCGTAAEADAPIMGFFEGVAIAAGEAVVVDAVTQGINIALGYQDGFNWKELAASAITGAITGGIGSIGSGVIGQVLTAAADNAIGQGVNMAMGLQKSFNWESVALSAAMQPVSEYINEKVSGGVTDGLSGSTDANPKSPSAFDQFAGQVAGKFVSGVITQVATTVAEGGAVRLGQIAADSFGNALGNSLTDYAVQKMNESANNSAADSKSFLASFNANHPTLGNDLFPIPNTFADAGADGGSNGNNGSNLNNNPGNSGESVAPPTPDEKMQVQVLSDEDVRASVPPLDPSIFAPPQLRVAADPGSSISTMMGSSNPMDIEAFMRANNLSDSRIYAGQGYLMPSSADYAASTGELGQATLDTDNATRQAAQDPAMAQASVNAPPGTFLGDMQAAQQQDTFGRVPSDNKLYVDNLMAEQLNSFATAAGQASVNLTGNAQNTQIGNLLRNYISTTATLGGLAGYTPTLDQVNQLSSNIVNATTIAKAYGYNPDTYQAPLDSSGATDRSAIPGYIKITGGEVGMGLSAVGLGVAVSTCVETVGVGCVVGGGIALIGLFDGGQEVRSGFSQLPGNDPHEYEGLLELTGRAIGGQPGADIGAGGDFGISLLSGGGEAVELGKFLAEGASKPEIIFKGAEMLQDIKNVSTNPLLSPKSESEKHP